MNVYRQSSAFEVLTCQGEVSPQATLNIHGAVSKTWQNCTPKGVYCQCGRLIKSATQQEQAERCNDRLQLELMQLQARYQKGEAKLAAASENIKYLSKQSLKYAKNLLQLARQVQAKKKQVYRLNEEIEVIRSEATQLKKMNNITNDCMTKSYQKKLLQHLRKGKNLQQSLQVDILQNLLQNSYKQPKSIYDQIENYLVCFSLNSSQDKAGQDLKQVLEKEKQSLTTYINNFGIKTQWPQTEAQQTKNIPLVWDILKNMMQNWG